MSFYTTNSEYGRFYYDKVQKQVKEDQEKRRASNQYSNAPTNYSNNYHQNKINTINNRSKDILLKDLRFTINDMIR